LIRILHVTPTIAPRYGGVSTVIWPLTAALRDTGNLTVEIATTDADGPTDRLISTDLPTETVPVRLFPAGHDNPLGRGGPLADWLMHHAKDYQVFHVHTVWNVAAVSAARAAETAGLPYVLSTHGMLSGYSWARHPWKKRAYWWAVQRRTILRAAAVHATSPAEVAEVRACGVTAPVEDIPLGMESAAFDTPARPAWLRDRCGPTAGDRPIVLFLSRLHPKKGVTDVLLPAFAALKADAVLAIAGGADESAPGYADEVRAAVGRLGLAGRVTVIGPVAPADRWAAFDGAAVFCLPSHNENFGVVVTEAMARGCPVVVTEGVAAGAYAAGAGCGAVVPRTPAAVAAALDKELADPAGRAARGTAGREYVRSRLTWEAVAARLQTLYQTLLPGRPER
jgi:glycosyltransferase involved in cell wall biosynthesis